MKGNADKTKKKFNNYLKFSSMAIQMGIVITACAFGGQWLDEKQGNHFPIWTLVLILFSIFGMLYKFIREVIKMGKEDK